VLLQCEICIIAVICFVEQIAIVNFFYVRQKSRGNMSHKNNVADYKIFRPSVYLTDDTFKLLHYNFPVFSLFFRNQSSRNEEYFLPNLLHYSSLSGYLVACVSTAI